MTAEAASARAGPPIMHEVASDRFRCLRCHSIHDRKDFAAESTETELARGWTPRVDFTGHCVVPGPV